MKKTEKDGLLKRVKSIQDKNEELLTAIKNKTKNIKQMTNFIKDI